MWSAGDLPFAFAIAVLFVRWLSSIEASDASSRELLSSAGEPTARARLTT